MTRVLEIAVIFAIAWVFQWILTRALRRFINANPNLRQERQRTLRGLVKSTVGFFTFLTATLISLGLFVDITSIIWMVGLFSAAFGLGARPLISDVLAGLNYIFEDTIAVGDKVEIMDFQGVVERINIRTMRLRGTNGELIIIPNGEIRVVRNYTRGSFSTSDIKIIINSSHLGKTLATLEKLGKLAVFDFPDLLEPWKLINTSGTLGQQTELTLLIKTRYGKAAELRPHLLEYVQAALANIEVELV